MKKNVIDYFSITTKPKVMIFDDKSTSIQISGQWTPQWAYTMKKVNLRYIRNEYMILEAGTIFRNINKLENIEPNPTNNNIYNVTSISANTDILIIYLNEFVIEISLDIFLFFWMEKILILLLHIYRNEYMESY